MKKSFIAGFVSRRMGNGGPVLELVYDKLDAIPEPFRPLYTEADGRFILSAVNGMKTQADIDRLSSALNKERSDHKAARDKFAPLANMEVQDILQKLDSIPALEEAAKAGGNVDNLVQAKLNQHTAPLQRQIAELQAQLTTAQEQAVQLQQRERGRLIGDAVQAAVVATKALPEAADDLKLLASAIFEVDEHGKVISKDGIQGVTPGISPEVWLTEMKRSKPYFWPASQGANGRPGAGGAGGVNPWSKDGWNMTEQGRIVRESPEKAAQLAAAAGTTVGGMRPV